MNRPHFHMGQNYDPSHFYYENDFDPHLHYPDQESYLYERYDNDHDLHQPCEQDPYMELHNHERFADNAYAVEAQPTASVEQKPEPPTKVDDLNFQLAGGWHGKT